MSKAGELEGLDLHEHGMFAYPEYVIHGYSPGLHHVEPSVVEKLPIAVPSPSSAT